MKEPYRPPEFKDQWPCYQCYKKVRTCDINLVFGMFLAGRPVICT